MARPNDIRALTHLEALSALPTAPLYEHHVLDAVAHVAADLDLAYDRDTFGNLWIRYENRPRGQRGSAMIDAPFVLVAHTDHPGFEVLGHEKGVTQARWMGGVGATTLDGARVVAYTDPPVEGLVTGVVMGDRGRADQISIEFDGRPPTGSFGSLALPPFKVERGAGWVRGRALDDLAGVAAILAALETCVRQGTKGVLWALLTRAEEIGFVGAEGALRSGKLPPGARLISVETSSAHHGGVASGAGAVIRVGDRSTLYDPETVAALWMAAEELAENEGHLAYQRALMGGGTCEAALFASRGFRSAGVALPLENYHNMGPDGPAQEAIQLADLNGATRLLTALCDKGYDWCARVEGGGRAFEQRAEEAATRWLPRLAESARVSLPQT